MGGGVIVARIALVLALMAGAWPACAAVVIPAGTVLTMTGSSCPAGFTAYTAAAGRVVVGVGTLGSDTYALGATGGSARHTLTLSEVPSHSHYVYFQGNFPLAINQYGSGYALLSLGNGSYSTAGGYSEFNTDAQGGGQPHENRPPYIALTQCVLGADFTEGGDMTGELFVWAIVVLAFAGGVIAGQQR